MLRDANFIELEVAGQHNFDPASDSNLTPSNAYFYANAETYQHPLCTGFHVDNLVSRDKYASSERNILPSYSTLATKR